MCGRCATMAPMVTMASRDLRNHTAKVLAEVAKGGRVTITVHGRPVAEISPARTTRPVSIGRRELLAALVPADPELRDDLADLAGETTDDLGPIG